MVRVRFAARALAAAALLLALTGLPARAQALQRLTVTAFSFTADTAHPQLEVPFHLIVSLHVRENVGEIDDVTLPILAELELQGDERSLRSGPGGTDYREVLTVVAHHTGPIAISPVTLQAIDARDGKAKEFYTNALRLNVAGGALEPLGQGAASLRALWDWLRTLLLWALCVASLFAVAFLLLRRRPRPAAVAAPAAIAVPVVPAPSPRPRSRREQLQDARSVLSAERTRASAVRVRTAVWRMLGANEGATLADVLATPGLEPGMHDVLRSLERAAFTYDADLAPAIDAACLCLERYLA